jgi:hypothetical protein
VDRSRTEEASTFPQFAPPSTTKSLVVTVENGRANFSRYPNAQRGKKASADLFIKCRVDLTMTQENGGPGL